MNREQYFIDKPNGRYEVMIFESAAGVYATVKGVPGGSAGGTTDKFESVTDVWEAVHGMIDSSVDDTEEWVD